MRDLRAEMIVDRFTDRPYLSIVVTGRNDNFGGDFNERFMRALTFNHEQLAAAGVAHEFVFVEWAPLSGRPFLASDLEKTCSDLVANRQLVSYVVDPKYHEAFSLNDRLKFQEFLAKNVGVRHSSGEFVLTTNTDIYLGREVVARLAAHNFEPGILYRTVRIDLRDELVLADVDWEVLEDPRNIELINEIRPPCYTNASGDFLLLDRDTYHRLGGFNEVYRVAKIHIDSNFCVKAYSAGVPLVDIESPVYHVGSGTLHANRAKYTRSDHAPWGDIYWNSKIIYENPPDWGLASAPRRQISGSVQYLDFSWDAVPPMLDLKRVRVPAARVGRASV